MAGNQLNVKFNSLMNNFHSGPDSIPDPSFFRRLEDILSPSREASSPHLRKFGYSVQPLNSIGSGYLWRPETSQVRHDGTLDNFALSYLSSIEHCLLFPELSSQEYPGGVVPEFCTSSDSQQAKPSLSCVATAEPLQTLNKKPSLSCVATAEPLTEYTRQKVLTETVKFKATESFVSGVPMSLLSEEVGISETPDKVDTKKKEFESLLS